MARIRSIKPEFWSDTAIVNRSAFARLLFVGIWNHADDFGVVKDDPDQLVLQILPRDRVDAEELVEELIDARLLLRKVSEDGTPVLVVRTWERHQKVDKRSPGRYGEPSTFTDPPPEPTPTRAEAPRIPPSPNPGREGSGVETSGVEPPVAAQTTSRALAVVEAKPVVMGNVEMVFHAWQEATGRHRAQLDRKRRGLITAALKAYPTEDVIDAVRGWRHSPHHRGENERSTVYDSLDLLLRDAEHIERFRDLERHGPANRPPKLSRGRANVDAVMARLGEA